MGSSFILRTLRSIYGNMHREIDSRLKEESIKIKKNIDELEEEYKKLDKLRLERPSPINFFENKENRNGS